MIEHFYPVSYGKFKFKSILVLRIDVWIDERW